jgi:hypothetical protein
VFQHEYSQTVRRISPEPPEHPTGIGPLNKVIR